MFAVGNTLTLWRRKSRPWYKFIRIPKKSKTFGIRWKL